jgi:hypothetical protein
VPTGPRTNDILFNVNRKELLEFDESSFDISVYEFSSTEMSILLDFLHVKKPGATFFLPDGYTHLGDFIGTELYKKVNLSEYGPITDTLVQDLLSLFDTRHAVEKIFLRSLLNSLRTRFKSSIYDQDGKLKDRELKTIYDDLNIETHSGGPFLLLTSSGMFEYEDYNPYGAKPNDYQAFLALQSSESTFMFVDRVYWSLYYLFERSLYSDSDLNDPRKMSENLYTKRCAAMLEFKKIWKEFSRELLFNICFDFAIMNSVFTYCVTTHLIKK